MTMTEKILARAFERSELEPGENVWVNVDFLMTHDVCGLGTFGIFKREFGKNAKGFLHGAKHQVLLLRLTQIIKVYAMLPLPKKVIAGLGRFS